MSDAGNETVLALLGVVAGFAIVQVLDQYMNWVRSKYPSRLHRLMRKGFLVVPILVLGIAATVLVTVRERDAFFVGFLTGFVVGGALDFLRWWRGRKG